MASGRPDWHQIITMEGWDGSDFLPIKVDSEGQLHALMKGAYGATFKTVKLDTDGQLYAILRGDFSGTLKTIAVDTNGVMKANLVAQDVAKLYAYVTSGKTETYRGSGVTDVGETEYSILIEDHGTLQGGWVQIDIQGPLCTYEIEVKVDAVTCGKKTIDKWVQEGFKQGIGYPMWIGSYPINGADNLIVHFAHDVAFDDSFEFLFENDNDAITISWSIQYATTPDA